MKKIIALLAALMLLCCGCQAEVTTEVPAETAAVTPAITDAATFAEACAAYGEYPFGAFPNTILLDNAAFETAITSGSGVVFIADPSDLNSRVLAPVLFEQMAKSNMVLQMHLPDAVSCEGLMQRVVDGGISITGNKALAQQLAEEGGIPSGAVLYLKEGKIVAMHMGSLKNRTDEAAALTEDEVASITDMLQFQLDKLLSGSCEVGC